MVFTLNSERPILISRGISCKLIIHYRSLPPIMKYRVYVVTNYPREFRINKELYGKYELLGEYADMHDLLESRVIEGRSFAEVIMDDYTELLGQD